MSKKKEEKLNVTSPEVNMEDTEKEIKPDVVNVEPASPEVNVIDENNQPTEGENEPVEKPEEEMVKLKIEKKFTDKYDNSIHYKKGLTYEFKVERAEELLMINVI